MHESFAALRDRRPRLAAQLRRWVLVGMVGGLLMACSKEPPLPAGVDPRATPRVIVSKERIRINGHELRVRGAGEGVLAPWVEALGAGERQPGLRAFGRDWPDAGMFLLVTRERGQLQSSALAIFLRRGQTYSMVWDTERSAALARARKMERAPRQPFPGYLEVDGVPIGPAMSKDELRQWRRHLGLPPLQFDPLFGGYYTYEKGKYSQTYYFDPDGYLAWVDLL